DSPGLELVVNGAQVYAATGQRLWTSDCLGYSGVGKLSKDGELEVVCVRSGKVRVFSKSGNERWSRNIPANGKSTHGGAPNIGNFTGDENLEIGTAGGYYYVVFDKD